MILNFKWKDYYCQYYAGSYFVKDVCFSKDIKNWTIDDYAHVTIVFPHKKQVQRNYCLIDEKTLIWYFNEIAKLLGFTIILLSKSTYNYKLQFKCFYNQRYYIYCAMYLRYVYEYPFNILLYAALKNKDNFPELNITQIIQFYITLFYEGARCHCPTTEYQTFYNINAKSQFNLLRDYFNSVKCTYFINTKYIKLMKLLEQLNTKQLPYIVDKINSIANEYYVKHKENICRW